jgi:hypothetical protein
MCFVARGARVAGRLAFPAPSMALVRRRTRPPRVSGCSALVSFPKERGHADPPELRSPSELLFCCPGWNQPPPLGFVVLPSVDTPSERPLPSMLPCASVPRCHPRNPVPSSWFLTTSTGSSARRSRACCIPLPTWGSPRFLPSGHPLSLPRPACFLDVRGIPRSATTPRRISATAALRHRSRCPLAVPSCRTGPVSRASVARVALDLSRTTGAPTTRPCSIAEFQAPAPPLPVRPRPVPSWAFFPFKVLPLAGVPPPVREVRRRRSRGIVHFEPAPLHSARRRTATVACATSAEASCHPRVARGPRTSGLFTRGWRGGPTRSGSLWKFTGRGVCTSRSALPESVRSRSRR